MQSRLSTVQVESEQWTVHSPNQTQLEKKNPPYLPPTRKKREAPSLQDVPSHWLQGISIPKIGCHYFWPELIALPKNTLPIMRVDATRFRSLFLLISTLVVGESRRPAPIPTWREVYWWRLGRDVHHCWAGIRNCIKPLPSITAVLKANNHGSQKNKIPISDI